MVFLARILVVESTFEDLSLCPAGLLDTRIWLAQAAAVALKLRWVLTSTVGCGTASPLDRQALEAVSSPAHRTWENGNE